MYWPSTPSDGEFVFKEKDGELLDPDVYLSKYADWRDTSMWPVSTRQSEVVQRKITKQADPLSKEGAVGAFCRAYTMEEAIEAFLLVENAEREGKRQRIAEMTDFLNKQSAELEEYDEQLVRRLIEKVTIYEDKLTVEFKSGIEIDEEI